jgi:hypothetical protein
LTSFRGSYYERLANSCPTLYKYFRQTAPGSLLTGPLNKATKQPGAVLFYSAIVSVYG